MYHFFVCFFIVDHTFLVCSYHIAGIRDISNAICYARGSPQSYTTSQWPHVSLQNWVIENQSSRDGIGALSLLSSFEMEVCFETLFGRKMFNKDFIKYLFRIPVGRNFFRTSSMFRRHMRGRWKSIRMKSCRIIAIIAVLEKDPRESKVLERCIYQHQK